MKKNERRQFLESCEDPNLTDMSLDFNDSRKRKTSKSTKKRKLDSICRIEPNSLFPNFTEEDIQGYTYFNENVDPKPPLLFSSPEHNDYNRQGFYSGEDFFQPRMPVSPVRLIESPNMKYTYTFENVPSILRTPKSQKPTNNYRFSISPLDSGTPSKLRLLSNDLGMFPNSPFSASKTSLYRQELPLNSYFPQPVFDTPQSNENNTTTPVCSETTPPPDLTKGFSGIRGVLNGDKSLFKHINSAINRNNINFLADQITFEIEGKASGSPPFYSGDVNEKYQLDDVRNKENRLNRSVQ